MRKITLLLLLFVCAGVQGFSQRTITGRIIDGTEGTPIGGASIVAVGSKEGVKADANGRYEITIPSSVKALEFSAIGYKTEQRAVSANVTSMDIALVQTDDKLKEVVVTAFGIKKDKKTLGYGVTQVQAAELTRAHTTNVTNALAAKVPGVRVQGAGGSFTSSSIIIRGNNTFSGSNQPLFVVDGIPIDNGGGGNPLQNGPSTSSRAIDLNQDDIESMSVLKGQSAAALYGSRAANGVIIITTKKGRANQKNSIQFSTSYQLETVNRLPDFQNSYGQGAGGVFSPISQQSWGPLITGQTITNMYNPVTNLNDRTGVLAAFPNNVKDVFTNGTNWQNNVAFSGGSDKNTFRFSYGYLKNTGVIENNVLNRHNVSLNTSSKVNNYLTVTASANYSNNASKRTQQGNQLANPVFRLWMTPRTYDLTGLAFEDAAGNQRFPLGEDNPYWTIKHNRFNDEINRLIGNVAFNFKINKWLNFDYKLGTDAFSTFRHAYDQIGSRGGANTTANGAGGIREVRANYRSLNSNGYFTVNRKINKDFSATAVVGTEFQQIYSNFAQLDGKGVIVRDFEQLSNTATFSPSPQNSSNTFRLMGIYADINVNYKNIANLNLTGRQDKNSIFKPGNDQYFYPAIAGSVNITELFPAIKNKVIDNIKIRGNYSRVGRGTPEFVYSTDSYIVGAGSADGFGPTITFPFNGIQGFTLSNAAGDANLGPEFNDNKEIGLEVSLFNGRVGFEITKYKLSSTDLIFGVPVSAASGITSKTTNAGSMSTNGVEGGLTVFPIKKTNLTWEINLNYTQYKSTVGTLAPGVTNIFLGGFVTPNIRLVAGEEYGQLYGNAYQRNAAGKMIVGANGLPLVTPNVQRIGNPNPNYTLGVTNTVNYKKFSFSFLLDYKNGGDQYSRNIADIQRNGAGAETAEFARYDAQGNLQRPYMFDAVFANGTPNNVNVSAEQYYGNSGKYAAAEGFIYNTTWFRVREASLSYSLPGSLLNKTPFGGAELSIFGRNLFLRAPNYPHLDPEQNALGVSNAQGLEFNALPQTRSMGVALKFNL